MKISVAMATYNGENFIIEQLDSILQQTRKVDEVIICDDRSSDNTVAVIKEYIQQNKLAETWKVFINEENLGYAGNFYHAMERTTGDVIFFCDQDDIWILDRVENMVRVMEDNPKVLMLGSEFEPFSCSEDAPKIKESVLNSFVNDGSLEHIPFNKKTIFIGSEGCTMCIRRSFFEAIKDDWFTSWAHDEYVWKLALCLDGCYIYHKTTLKRRMHSGNVSKRKMRDLDKRVRFFEELYKSHEKTLEFAARNGCDKKLLKLIGRNMKATDLRIDLMKKRKICNTVPLVLFYLDCYHSKKSVPVELMMALKGGK